MQKVRDERKASRSRFNCNTLESQDLRKVKKPTSLTVSLNYKKKLLCTFLLNTEQHSTSDLLQYALGVFRSNLSQTVLGVECGNSQLDYYIQCPRRSLEVFKSSLTLTPFLEHHDKGINRYRFLKVIGVGGFSKVYLARSKRDGKFYAIKLLQKRKVIESRKTKILMNERNILSRVNHPFILKLYQSFQTHLFFCFVLEYCPGGELFYALSKNRRFSEQEIRFYSCQLLETIFYLHRKNILYRDLKPQNILLDADGHIKLIDFGVSKPNVNKQTVCTSFCGSPPYMPPEIVKKQGHSFPVDYYCLGALMYQLACGYPPFDAENEHEIFYAILHNEVEYPETMSKQFKSLLKGLLNKDPRERLGSKGGAEEILNHKFYQTTNINEILNGRGIPPIIPRINALNVSVNNVVTQFIDLQKKLEIEMELQCNIYQKTLPSFQFVNYALYPRVEPPRKTHNEESKEEYFSKQVMLPPPNMTKKQRNLKKSSSRPQLSRYNSTSNIRGQSRSKSKSRNSSKTKNQPKTKPNVFIGYYFDRGLTSKPPKDLSKQMQHQFSMTNISSHVYFS